MNEKKYFKPVETKIVHRVIFAWEDDKEERWLEEMSVSGWHLTGAVPFTWYFQKVEPARRVYRLDYKLTLDKDYPEYRQIFADSVGNWCASCQTGIITASCRKTTRSRRSSTITTPARSNMSGCW